MLAMQSGRWTLAVAAAVMVAGMAHAAAAQQGCDGARWADRAQNPVRVWVAPSSGLSDWKAIYVTEARAAFTAWAQLGFGVRFQLDADSADAELRVTWVERFNEPISGRAHWTCDDKGRITSARIALAVHHQNGRVLNDESMRAIAMHEIGHALGIGHVDNSTSVMSDRVRVSTLTDADAAAARRRYGP